MSACPEEVRSESEREGESESESERERERGRVRERERERGGRQWGSSQPGSLGPWVCGWMLSLALLPWDLNHYASMYLHTPQPLYTSVHSY